MQPLTRKSHAKRARVRMMMMVTCRKASKFNFPEVTTLRLSAFFCLLHRSLAWCDDKNIFHVSGHPSIRTKTQPSGRRRLLIENERPGFYGFRRGSGSVIPFAFRFVCLPFAAFLLTNQSILTFRSGEQSKGNNLKLIFKRGHVRRCCDSIETQ